MFGPKLVDDSGSAYMKYETTNPGHLSNGSHELASRYSGDRYSGDRYSGDRYSGDRYSGVIFDEAR